MADDGNEDSLSDIKGSKEETALNQSNGKQETKSSMLIQSPQILSQFASPLTTKRSSSESSQAKQSFHCKRAKYNNKDNDDSQSCEQSNEKKELEIILRKKEDILRKLKLVKMYRSKNNLTDLEELIGKWRSICQQAAQDLFEKFSQEHTMTMGQFLDGLRVTHDLIRYSEDEEVFY